MQTRADPQQLAIHHDRGPLLVTGAAGTGKSFVLVERWLRLAGLVGPHRVLLVVGSRREARRLRDDLVWRLPQQAVIEVPAHTWHALAYHLVTRYYRTLSWDRPPALLSSAEQWALVRELLESERRADWGRYGQHLLSTAFVDEVAAMCLRRSAPSDGIAAAFTAKYIATLEGVGRMDTTLLVDQAAALLDTDPSIRSAVQARFPHVLIDDAHQLNVRQQRLALAVAGEQLVAASRTPLSWGSWAATVELTTCHRFGPEIGAVVDRFRARTGSYAGAAGSASAVLASTFGGEIDTVARTLRSAHLHEHIPYDDMAVLLATPSALAPLRRALDGLGVPWHADATGRPLASEPAFRAVVDLARVALEPQPSPELLAGVLGAPLSGVAPGRVRELRREAFVRSVSLLDVVQDAEDCAELRALIDLLRSARALPADEAFRALYERSTWCAQVRTSDLEAHAALYALAGALNKFVERRPGATLEQWLASSARAEGEQVEQVRTDGGVHLLTPQAAAGREWTLVCVLGLSEGALTPSRATHALFAVPAAAAEQAVAAAEAERELFELAVTRARRRLLVTCSPGPSGRSTPSRLVEQAFESFDEPESPQDPLTVREAVASMRRTLATGTPAERAAAAAAIASVPDVSTAGWWWRRDWTAGAPLTPEGKLTTSYSRIGKYENCPLRYALESVLGLDPESTYQMKFGSLVHRCIERAEKGELTSLVEVDKAFKDEFDHRDYPNKVFARTFWRSGRKMLAFWWNAEFTGKPWKTVAVEYAFNDLMVDGHTIRGRIDRVAASGTKLYLIDYKTAKNMASYEEARGSLQLAIYYLAAKTYDDLKEHGEPSQMQLVYPGIAHWQEPDQMARRVQMPAEAEVTLDKLKSILANAAEEHFEPSATADCGWCRMKPLCPRYPEGKETGP